MRAGLFLAYWPWFTPQEQVELAVLADELGLDSVWVSEAWGQDAVSVLGLLAGKTERVALGSGLFQIPARAPGRDRDGRRDARRALGRALPARARRVGPAGLRGLVRRAVRAAGQPHARVRRDRAHRAGAQDRRATRAASTACRWRARKPLKLLAKPVQERIPVYLGAVGPKAVEQVGEIADGWLPFMVSPEHAATLFEPLDRGLAKAGRTRADIDVAACTAMAVEDDLGRGARRRAPVAGLLPRRDGLAREELLRRAGRARRPRRRGARVPGARSWAATASAPPPR